MSIEKYKFTDRSEIMNILNEALIRFNEGSTVFQLLSIHGIGGIGKTRLVKEFKKILSPEPVIYVSFEIEKRSEIIGNLYKIRKEIEHSCPLFDFALLRYWEMTNPSVLDDSFMNIFQKGFFVSLLDFAAEIVGGPIGMLGHEFKVPPVIAPSTIVDFVNTISRKVPQLQHSSLFTTISSTSADQLIEKLPTLLGIEIGHLISIDKILNPVFIFDSYQESQPYSESEEWLYQLVKGAGQGVYIITSRERLHWNESSECLTVHNLECYPEDDARKLLEETINNRPDLVEQIIESTQCVPIYNRIKIYQADCYMLSGQFKSALASLVLLNDGYISSEDNYSIHRTIGHIQRFNFQLIDAKKTYSLLMKEYHNNSVYREYLSANLAEAQCYFPDDNFIRRNQKVLVSMQTPYNPKNKGKVLYALAIANIVKKHYRAAQSHIDACIDINREDGYQSGELFAYMAQAYLDYALTGFVSQRTNEQIECLLTRNGA